MKPATIGATQVSRILGVHRTCVYNWLNEGKVREVRIGGRRLVPLAEVERLVGEPFRPEWIEKSS